MADDTKATQTPESTETQEAPMPSAEQKTAEVTETVEARPQGETAPVEEPKLPDGTKERTTQEFDKLKSQLAEERERRTRYERVFNQTSPVQQAQERKANPDWFDPDTGEVQVNVLDNKIGGLEAQLNQANQVIKRFVSSEDERQSRVAYESHPELNPSGEKFNEEFHNAVVGYLTQSIVEGKTVSMKDAADVIKRIGSTDEKAAEKRGAADALEKLSPKEQAALEATGRSDRRTQVTSQDDLVRRTRNNDFDAVAERLKNIPPVGR